MGRTRTVHRSKHGIITMRSIGPPPTEREKEEWPESLVSKGGFLAGPTKIGKSSQHSKWLSSMVKVFWKLLLSQESLTKRFGAGREKMISGLNTILIYSTGKFKKANFDL